MRNTCGCYGVIVGGVDVAVGPPPVQEPAQSSRSTSSVARNTKPSKHNNPRFILIDTQPLLTVASGLSGSGTSHHKTKAGMSDGNQDQSDSIRVFALQRLMFMLRVCDTLIVVQDGSSGADVDWEVLELVRIAATMHGNCVYVPLSPF